MRKNIEKIVDVNCEEARRMLSVYESISTTLISPRERKDVESMGKKGFGENNTAPTLQEFKNCVEKYLIGKFFIDSFFFFFNNFITS